MQCLSLWDPTHQHPEKTPTPVELAFAGLLLYYGLYALH